MAEQPTERRIPRVFFTGAQSTGKTTLLNRVLPMFPRFKSESGVAQRIMDNRQLNCDIVFSNPDSTMAFQGYVIEEMKIIDQENEAAGQGYMTDRSLLDPAVYAIMEAGTEAGQRFQQREEFTYLLDKIRSNCLLFLIHPTEECVEHDGRRKTPIMEEMLAYTQHLLGLCRHHRLTPIEIKTPDMNQRVQQVDREISAYLSTMAQIENWRQRFDSRSSEQDPNELY